MRLSWYSDTGVAVFSIWQGGRCSGTFRLPVDDLARMVEILGRSPGRGLSGPARPGGEDRPGSAPDDVATGYLAGPASGSYESDFPTDYPSPRQAPPRAPLPRAPVPAADIHPDDPLGLGYQGGSAAGQPDGGYSPAGERPDYRQSGDRPGRRTQRENGSHPGAYPEPGPYSAHGPHTEHGSYPEHDSYPGRGSYPEPGYPGADEYAVAYGGAGGHRGRRRYPGPDAAYEAPDGRTDPGLAAGEPPAYRPGHGPDYRRADTADYLPPGSRDFSPGVGRDYLPDGIAVSPADDLTADRYRSPGGSDSAVHSRSRRRPDDLADTGGPAYRPAPLGPGSGSR